MTPLPNIDKLIKPHHNEKCRQEYVSILRRHVLTNMAQSMRECYDTEVAPTFRRFHGRPPADGREIRKVMKDTLPYKLYSSMRYNAQEMTWESVREEVERALPDLIKTAREAASTNPAGGTLALNPSIKPPHYVSATDVHLMPGCWQSEHTKDDVSQGAIYAHGGAVFRGCLRPSRTKGGVGASVSTYLKVKYPYFKPQHILETGCTIGSNLTPYHDIFPEAELYGVDVAAPCLRYAHARDEARGIRTHYFQQDAEHLEFEENTFDLVVSSFFLHELTPEATRQIFREIFRVLKPGGRMVHMELPAAADVDAYYNFILDWDQKHNAEPWYELFRNMDFRKECAEAGFNPDNYFKATIPDIGGVSDDEFAAVALGTKGQPAHGNHTSWCIFGAAK